MATKAFKTIELSIKNSIATVKLDRPDKKNAMSFLMMKELLVAAKQIERNRYIRAVVITGGEDFCSGLDLQDLNQPKNLGFACWELLKPSPSLFQKVCLVWQSLPVPVIAHIDGVCLGAGLQLALGADIRIGSHLARLGLLEAKWGLVADMGLTQTAGFISPDALKELAMAAKIIDARAAFDFGLLTHVSDDSHKVLDGLLRDIESRSPDAILAAKRLINQMQPSGHRLLYQEKIWQLKLLFGKNRKISLKKAKDQAQGFYPRQFK